VVEWVYAPVIGAMKGAFRMLDLQFVERHWERHPSTGGAVVAINHVSYLDFIFAGYPAERVGRYVRFMAKDVVFRHPLAGPLMRGMHHIPVDREAGASAYAHALRALRDGEFVGVFPEGTTSRSYTIKEFKTGAARMAMEAQVPIVPVVTWGGQRIWTKAHPRDFRTRGRAITISVGEPFGVPPDADPVRVTEDLRGVMAALLDETIRAHPQEPDGPDDAWWLPPEYGGSALTREEAHDIEESERQARLAARRAKEEAAAAAPPRRRLGRSR
jgi:1-acyl-sn-glycerol-3-phosphate acyltransferase